MLTMIDYMQGTVFHTDMEAIAAERYSLQHV